MRDVILAGIPRAGTTLACVLLNQFRNTVALNEPFDVSTLPAMNDEIPVADRLQGWFARERSNVLLTGHASSKAQNGRMVSNVFSPERGNDGLRHEIDQLAKQSIAIDKELQQDFTLVVKHPHAFTVLIPVLKTRFTCYAIVRNPLAVLLSWESTAANWQIGRAPVAERLDPMLQAILSEIKTPTDRQIGLLRYYFNIYRAHLPLSSVVRYEDMVHCPQTALAVIATESSTPISSVPNMNCNRTYSRKMLPVYVQKLLHFAPVWEPFYSAADVEDLAEALLRE